MRIHCAPSSRLKVRNECAPYALFATLLPGDVTPYHSHRFPVTVYMIEGAFTLELDDREPVVIEAGHAFVEPAGVNMTGRNRGDVPARMALFYVCEPDAPFADPVNRDAGAH